MALTKVTGQVVNTSTDLTVGVLTATTVAIGGTLTYEDVTNVDSVGLITARNGIEVTDKGVQVGTGATVDSAGDNILTFLTNGNERIRVTSDGKVGINTDMGGAPASLYPFSVYRSTGTGYVYTETAQSGASAGLRAKAGTADFTIFTTQGTGQLAVYDNTNTAERLRIDSSGRLLVGATSNRSSSALQVEGTTFATSRLSLTQNSATANAGATLKLSKSKGTSNGSFTVVSSGDRLGNVQFSGADGSGDITAATIEAFVDNTPGSNDMPGRLVFSTTADGASSTTERMRIDSSGNVGINATSYTARLHVSGAYNQTGLKVLGGGAGYSSPLIVGAASGTEYMRVDDDGRVLSGVTSAPGTVGGFSHLNIKGTSINANGAIGLYRNTASPSSGQGIGAIYFANSDGNAGAYIQGQSDGTWGTNDYPGRLVFFTTADGASSATERMRINSSGIVELTQSGNNPRYGSLEASGDAFKLKAFSGNASHNATMQFFTGANSPTERMRIDSSGRVLIGTSSNQGGYLVQVKDSDASLTKLVEASGGNAVQMMRFRVHNSNNTAQSATLAGVSAETLSGWGGQLTFHTKAANGTPNETVTERARIDADGNFLVGKNELSDTTAGLSMRVGGVVAFEATVASGAAHCMMLNRQGDDGAYVKFRQANSLEGSITVSGSTVSYNGGHLARWSQLADGAARTEILRGSVLSNLNEMCEWGEEENEQLNRMKISDVEGDINVAGVFQDWDDNDDTYTNDFYCAMTGDFIIRIAQDTTVARGDLLMSAGDGTAKPQDDDIVRSKTIAKVTSTTVSTTYSDGSYCVPCVLMAC